MFCLPALHGLRELLLSGKQPNPIAADIIEVLYLFETCQSIDTIDGRTKGSWSVDINCDVHIDTPRFDLVSRMFQSRLNVRAAEETQKSAEIKNEKLEIIHHNHQGNVPREQKSQQIPVDQHEREVRLPSNEREAQIQQLKHTIIVAIYTVTIGSTECDCNINIYLINFFTISDT